MSRSAAEEYLASPLSRFKPWAAPNGASPQLDFIRAAETHKRRIFRAGNRAGKDQPNSEPVMTPCGFVPMGSLVVGSEVICGCGKQATVTGVFQQGVVNICRLELEDGSFTRCGFGHLWPVLTQYGHETIELSELYDYTSPVSVRRHSELGQPGRWVRVAKIKQDGRAASTCIQVSCECQTYLTRDLIVTHNTTVAAVDRLLHAQGWHPFDPQRGPTMGWVIALDWNTVGSVIWPTMKRWIDRSRVKIDWQRKTGIEIPNALFFQNGSEIHFKSSEAGREKVQGSAIHWAWIDEEHDQTVVEEVIARTLDYNGSICVSLTPVSRKAWVRDLENFEVKGVRQTKVIRASMRDAAAAGILSQDAVDKFLATLPERQRRVREFGDFASLEGLVYPDFSRDTHCLYPRDGQLYGWDGTAGNYPWPLPKHWPRFAAMDFGYSVPAAVVIACQDPHTGRLIVETVFYAKGITAFRWGEYLKRNLPQLEVPMAADWDAAARAELGSHGIETSAAIKEPVEAGLEAVDRLIYLPPQGRPKLMFVVHDEARSNAVTPIHEPTASRCDAYHLVHELEGYRYEERKEKAHHDPKDRPVKRDDHACDALRYLVMAVDAGARGAAPDVDARPEDAGVLAGAVPPSPWR